MEMQAFPHGPLVGEARPPGDKSISHRALMFAALAVGESRIEGLLEGEDVLATARALEALGVELVRRGAGAWTVHGVGVAGLAEPETVLDLGNAGTGARLLMGILAGHGFTSFLTGDASLRRRPMARVVEPLRAMGAEFTTRSGCRLPAAVVGSYRLVPITWRSPVASAQVKSAILLCGLHAPGETTVIEPLPSRDHTERMLAGMGAELRTAPAEGGGVAVTVVGQPELLPQSFTVPADPSSAAFPAVAAAAKPGSRIRLTGVGLNPSRVGAYTTLAEMGASIAVLERRREGGEEVGTLEISGGELRAVDVPAERAPSMIDEYPVLFVAAALARGRSRFRGLAELRVKESDRLAVMAEGLTACGVRCGIEGDDLWVEGDGGPPAGGARIDARLDHRIAMSFLVLGGLARAGVRVLGAETIATSFPGFAELMNGLGARITTVRSSEAA
jgi:3-phosphoshikimate 1-carboxyvinyltransferase